MPWVLTAGGWEGGEAGGDGAEVEVGGGEGDGGGQVTDVWWEYVPHVQSTPGDWVKVVEWEECYVVLCNMCVFNHEGSAIAEQV